MPQLREGIKADLDSAHAGGKQLSGPTVAPLPFIEGNSGYSHDSQIRPRGAGPGLIEYTLLLVCVCLTSAAMFLGMGGDLAKVWTNASKKGSKFS
jgi:hypothetical protein